MLRRLIVAAIITASLVGVGAVFFPGRVQAASASYCNDGRGQASFLRMPTWYKYLDPKITTRTDAETGAEIRECSLNFEFPGGVGKVLLAVFEILLRISILVAVALVIWGGFKYMISQGVPERVAGARTTIINAIVGIAIAIVATAVVNLIGNTLT